MLELQDCLSYPLRLQKLITQPGYQASSFTFAGKLFPFLTGHGAKVLITATEHAIKELSGLQERAEELVNYHNMPRIKFLGASLEVMKEESGSGKLVW